MCTKTHPAELAWAACKLSRIRVYTMNMQMRQRKLEKSFSVPLASVGWCPSSGGGLRMREAGALWQASPCRPWSGARRCCWSAGIATLCSARAASKYVALSRTTHYTQHQVLWTPPYSGPCTCHCFCLNGPVAQCHYAEQDLPVGRDILGLQMVTGGTVAEGVLRRVFCRQVLLWNLVLAMSLLSRQLSLVNGAARSDVWCRPW